MLKTIITITLAIFAAALRALAEILPKEKSAAPWKAGMRKILPALKTASLAACFVVGISVFTAQSVWAQESQTQPIPHQGIVEQPHSDISAEGRISSDASPDNEPYESEFYTATPVLGDEHITLHTFYTPIAPDEYLDKHPDKPTILQKLSSLVASIPGIPGMPAFGRTASRQAGSAILILVAIGYFASSDDEPSPDDELKCECVKSTCACNDGRAAACLNTCKRGMWERRLVWMCYHEQDPKRITEQDAEQFLEFYRKRGSCHSIGTMPICESMVQAHPCEPPTFKPPTFKPLSIYRNE